MIAHPNFYKSTHYYGTECEISNIESVQHGSQVNFTFLVKKTKEARYKEIGFKYKLKDSSGIVLQTNGWYANDMSVEEVTKGEFTLFDITSTNYVLEFNDYKG